PQSPWSGPRGRSLTSARSRRNPRTQMRPNGYCRAAVPGGVLFPESACSDALVQESAFPRASQGGTRAPRGGSERSDVPAAYVPDEGPPLYSFAPIAAAMDLVSSALAALTALLTPVVPAAAAGLSVMLLTVGVRLLLVPVGIAQVRAEKVRARIGPELARIGARHRDDPQKMAAEQHRVYSEAGSSPFAGCLPALVQMPVVQIGRAHV